MSRSKVIRAWKDPAYRNSLSSAEQADLPANPAGAIEIPETQLGQTAGGKAPHTLADECGLTYLTCTLSRPCSITQCVSLSVC
jgi:mersacidin/lichenicidin family type 2 lantibiotic